MTLIGHGSMRGKAGDPYWIGAYIFSRRGRYEGGYGAEVFRLLRDRAVELGATRVTANAPDVERRSALEAAGFKVVSALPRRLAKRRRGWGFVRLEWRP
ncbi:MAG TPA: hypothetical protein VGX27_09840 [Candidatus Dormibacteraeota bacterium]|nr:hypothetical protein [Candidatus Dormibacteraeota bacterium]